MYWDANHTDDHTAGWPAAGEIYSKHLLPKMASHQKALFVPGTFASRQCRSVELFGTATLTLIIGTLAWDIVYWPGTLTIDFGH